MWEGSQRIGKNTVLKKNSRKARVGALHNCTNFGNGFKPHTINPSTKKKSVENAGVAFVKGANEKNEFFEKL